MRESPRYAVEQRPTGSRRELLLRVGPGASVLDIGCWAGWAGAFLVEERNVTVDGVEPDLEMGSVAARTYRTVVPSTIEEALADLTADPDRRYDHLLFLDVLEHMRDPAPVLRDARALIKPGGSVLVSLPNVAHWSVRKELALGRWRYSDSGILDRTHLRFYTVDSARELLTESGWRIAWESFAVGQPPLLHLPDRWLQRLESWPRLFGVQVLFEAR
jgi:2-polyprenyl-3-methyl-5-hydroxy-6-metoxy-1,4-benzoquinol methylase